MKNLLLALLFAGCFSPTLLAQNSRFSAAEQEIIKVIDTFFTHFHQRDSAKLRLLCYPNVQLQAVKYKDGKPEISQDSLQGFLKAIGSIPTTLKIEERLLDYKVQIDADLATVWTPYQFFVNDKLSHQGANAFTLVRINGTWQITAIIDTRRK
jgi:hypothetical protein